MTDPTDTAQGKEGQLIERVFQALRSRRAIDRTEGKSFDENVALNAQVEVLTEVVDEAFEEWFQFRVKSKP